MKLYNINNIFVPLVEANILNVKDPYRDVSLVGYIEQFAQHLPNDITPQFIKKMQKLLAADERFHFAVRELPPGAPDWAMQAMQNRDLVAFVPNQELTDNIENVVHYLSAVYQNANQTEDNNVRVAAERELKAFPKLGNINDLFTKANAYFEAQAAEEEKKGPQPGAEAHGMKVIYNVGNGYVWYLLQTPDAYRREGQTMKNCIGSYWTLDKAKAQGMAIIILRKNVSGANQGESIVAARIHNEDNMIHEMKGKNNQPPIDRYMPPVLALVKKFKLNLSSSAQSDFSRTGYFYLDGEFVGKEEAIKRLLEPPKPIEKMGQYDIRSLTIPAGLPYELRSTISQAYGGVREGTRLLFLTQGEKTIMTAMVEGGSLKSIVQRSATLDDMQVNEAEEVKPKKEPLSVQFIKRLMELGLITSLSTSLKKMMMWQDGLSYNSRTNAFDPIKVSETSRGDREAYGWNSFTDKRMIKQIAGMTALTPQHLAGASDWNREEIAAKVVDPEEVKAVYINGPRQRDGGAGDNRLGLSNEVIAMFVMKDGTMKLHRVDMASDSESAHSIRTSDVVRKTSYRAADTNRRAKLVNSIAQIANKHNVKLPDSSAVYAGLVKDENGKLTPYKPKIQELSGRPAGKKIDLSKVPEDQYLGALFASLKFAGARTFHKVEDDDAAAAMVFPSGFNLEDRLVRTMEKMRKEGLSATEQGQEAGMRAWERRNRQITQVPEGKFFDTAAVARQLFGANRPDAIYMTTVGYGTQNKNYEVVMLVRDNKVLKVDGATSAETWQSWNDYEKVAEQLNQFADKNNLRFTYQALSHSALRELRVAGGRVTTETSKQATRAEKLERQGSIGREGTDELPFAQGERWVRMTPDEIQQWSRRDNKFAIRGSVWKLVVPKGGQEIVPLAVDVKDDKIVGMFHHGWRGFDDIANGNDVLPTQKGSIRANKAALASYVKQAMQTFGWERPKAKTAFADDSLKRTLERRFAREDDTFNMKTSTLERGYGDGSDIKKAEKLGLIRRSPGVRGMHNFSLTPRGQQVRRTLSAGGTVDFLDLMAARPVQAGWEKPEPAPLPEPERPAAAPAGAPGEQPARVPRAVRGGTKSEQALQWFTDFTTDNGRIPRRSEFIQQMQQDPFNMGAAGAQTYYYNTKKKYDAQQAGGQQQNESAKPSTLNLITEAKISPFGMFFISGRP